MTVRKRADLSTGIHKNTLGSDIKRALTGGGFFIGISIESLFTAERCAQVVHFSVNDGKLIACRFS